MAALNLAVRDWNRSSSANFSGVPADVTVGELLSLARNDLSLPRDTPYHLIYDGMKLNRTLTLDELGVEDDAEFTIAPEVSAGY
jgi:hypothetical protein